MNTGIEIIIIEIVSIKHPSTRTINCMIITITTGERLSSATQSTKEDVAPVAAKTSSFLLDPRASWAFLAKVASCAPEPGACIPFPFPLLAPGKHTVHDMLARLSCQ